MFRLMAFVCLSVSHLFGSIDNYLKTDILYFQPTLQSIDALFVFNNNRSKTVNDIYSQFRELNMEVVNSEIYNTHTIPESIISEFCSKNISPELLAQILNHLSIYKCALKNNLSFVMVVESKSTIKGQLEDIEAAIESLQTVDSKWDVLFLNTDYCSGKNGQDHITPQIVENGQLKPNKQMVSSLISKVDYRYGYSCYVISNRGMNKLLRYFDKKWPNLPLDQVAISLKTLRKYSVNKDIIINGLYPKNKKKKSLEGFFHRKQYPLGKEFWIDPIDLLTNSRLDVIVKYLYAKSILTGDNLELVKRCYLEHIRGWNNFYEGEPLKIGTDTFLNSFENLIKNLKKNGYKEFASPVPIDTTGQIINGSHRVGACLALNIPVKVKVVKEKSSSQIRSSFTNKMRNSHGLSKETVDYFVSEYIFLKPNTYILEVKGYTEEEYDLISRYIDIIDVQGECFYIESENYSNIEKLLNSFKKTFEKKISIRHL